MAMRRLWNDRSRRANWGTDPDHGRSRAVSGWLAGCRAVAEEQPVVAAFDLDGTLTRRDCVVPFLRYVAGDRGLATGFVRRAPQLAVAAVRGGRDRLKELATEAVFSGRPLAGVEAA